MLHYSTIVHDQLLHSGFIDLALAFPLSCLSWKMCFSPVFKRPSSLLTLTMSSFPSLKWKMYFFKAWNEFFPPAKLSVPWNEFLTANLILPSNTSSEQHRPDSISHQSGWSITSVDHKNHVTQVMHSLYCHQACGNPTSDFILARFIRWDIIYSINPVQFWRRVSISTVPGERER